MRRFAWVAFLAGAVAIRSHRVGMETSRPARQVPPPAAATALGAVCGEAPPLPESPAPVPTAEGEAAGETPGLFESLNRLAAEGGGQDPRRFLEESLRATAERVHPKEPALAAEFVREARAVLSELETLEVAMATAFPAGAEDADEATLLRRQEEVEARHADRRAMLMARLEAHLGDSEERRKLRPRLAEWVGLLMAYGR